MYYAKKRAFNFSFFSKLNYIQINPIETGFVTNAIDWKYSSARNYGNEDDTFLEIDSNRRKRRGYTNKYN